MTRLRQWLAIPLLIGALMLHGQGQVLRERIQVPTRPPPPEHGIADNNQVLSKDPDAVKRIAARIHQLEQEQGFKIYLVVEPVLIGSSVQELANDLRRDWLPEGNGIVLVFESDTRKIGIGQDMLGDPHRAENPARIPSYETTAIVNRAIPSENGALAPEVALETVVDNLANGFTNHFVRRGAPPPSARSVRTALLVVGGLALLGLGLIGAGGLIRHSSMTRIRVFRFPVVDRPERLGAPCGGSVTARRFAPGVSQR